MSIDHPTGLPASTLHANTLPSNTLPSNTLPSNTGADPADPAPRARLVIAEDEAIIRLDLKELLVEEGYAVVGETGRGDEAVELVRSLRPDAAILDIKMPGLDGLSAARLISEDRMAAVLILTAFSQRDLIEQASDAGALAYIVKPFQRNDLVPAIELALARFAEIQSLAGAARDLGERLEARKIVDRAKGRLMDTFAMTEDHAFSWLRAEAMRRRLKIPDVARLVVDDGLRPSVEPNPPGEAHPDEPT